MAAEESVIVRTDNWAELMEQFDSGAPIPTANLSDMKQMWDASRRMQPKPNSAMGLVGYAAYGVDAATGGAEKFIPLWLRGNLLAALVARGVLNDHLHGDELDEKVIRAAAIMPCNKDDLAEAVVQLRLAQSPAEVVAKAKEEMRAKGYDADKPRIDDKFFAWMRDNC